MLTVHHLNNSRSQRILWLLEELELDYKLKCYQRDATTNLAPPVLEAVHPLGKSPAITGGSNTFIESGAIIDYILRAHGQRRLIPVPGSVDREQYRQWLHYGEGSAMLPLMLRMYTGRLPDGGAALQPRINGELNRHCCTPRVHSPISRHFAIACRRDPPIKKHLLRAGNMISDPRHSNRQQCALKGTDQKSL